MRARHKLVQSVQTVPIVKLVQSEQVVAKRRDPLRFSARVGVSAKHGAEWAPRELRGVAY
eukprot:7278412-Alexandrium_andersonii.AAC.1